LSPAGDGRAQDLLAVCFTTESPIEIGQIDRDERVFPADRSAAFNSASASAVAPRCTSQQTGNKDLALQKAGIGAALSPPPMVSARDPRCLRDLPRGHDRTVLRNGPRCGGSFPPKSPRARGPYELSYPLSTCAVCDQAIDDL